MINVTFKPSGISVQVERETTILNAARQAGVMIESPCDGIGTCKKCRVYIEDTFKNCYTEGGGLHKLTDQEKEKGFVLACRTEILEDIEVYSESTENQNKTLKILSEGKTFDYKIDPFIKKVFDENCTKVYGGVEYLGEEEGNTQDIQYGITVDIGTTTVVSALIDMITGKEIDSVSSLNPQSLYAQDVLTRIKFASEAEGLKIMYQGISSEINTMVSELCDRNQIKKQHVYEVVYSGNTTMIHLAANENPESLGKYPYTPILKGGCIKKAADVGISIASFGVIYFPPIISSYVGPDITSGVLATDLQNGEETILLIDIGTNGEMVMAKNRVLSATSTAAGPAFEGMNITFGMRAGKGAIEYFDIGEQGEAEIRTIGDEKAVGICGSGLFDIVGELIENGVITSNGRFIKPEQLDDSSPLKKYLKPYQEKLAFEAAPGIFLTLKDIRQVQLAKGAIRAGVEALFISLDVEEKQVDRVLIAGSFGYHLRAKSLVNMGILPKSLEEKIEFVGNTSKTGGTAFLLNHNCRKTMEELVGKIQSVELANVENFDKIFIKAMGF